MYHEIIQSLRDQLKAANEEVMRLNVVLTRIRVCDCVIQRQAEEFLNA
jgi:hypothetical protein